MEHSSRIYILDDRFDGALLGIVKEFAALTLTIKEVHLDTRIPNHHLNTITEHITKAAGHFKTLEDVFMKGTISP